MRVGGTCGIDTLMIRFRFSHACVCVCLACMGTCVCRGVGHKEQQSTEESFPCPHSIVIAESLLMFPFHSTHPDATDEETIACEHATSFGFFGIVFRLHTFKFSQRGRHGRGAGVQRMAQSGVRHLCRIALSLSAHQLVSQQKPTSA